MSHLQEAYESHQDEGQVVFGENLIYRNSVDAIAGFQNEFGLIFPIV